MILYIIIGGASLLAGCAIAAVIIGAALRASSRRRQKKRGQHEKSGRKVEFSKLILGLVLLTYFVGVFVGVKISLIDTAQLGVLLAFIGGPTAAAIGFYAWKAKAENIIKIKQAHPEETEGIPVDLNNIHHS